MKRNNEIYKVEKPEIDGNLITYNKNEEHKFLDLHEYHKEWKNKIRQSNLDNLKSIRKNFVNDRKSLDIIIKKSNISEGMRKFLKGKRKIITNLITKCNERIVLINKVINNGINMPIAIKFMDISSRKLDSGTFQKILSESIKDVKTNEYQLSIIKEFLKKDENYNK